MKIKYRFAFTWSEARALQLRALGLKVQPPADPRPEVGGIAVSFALEGAPGWSEACSLIRSWNGATSVTTEFTAAEISEAAHCALQVVHASGYPQPERDFLYLEQAYDLSARCPKCGEGAVQVAPFRIKKTLKWGRNAFLKLNWVEEACFMQTSVWSEHLRPLGIGVLPVEDTKGSLLDEVVQLDLGPVVPLCMGELDGVRCEKCGRERYQWHDRGFFPSIKNPPDVPIFRSSQRFGVEHQSANAMIVSATVANAIRAAGLRGVELWPCAPAG
ncbi:MULTISPECIES: hypothetical protein [Stenotrophomonas]|jgi:hypothetical protein|nr:MULTISPECIES: hypothetical protein [Stenotrophomonas]MBH1409116.1 hypothetical protein [Stenotrophomonas maltophilia]MBH1744820.1 hypothetical protein [Stenotrophomonas maltophilia]MBH1867731.1 hypothetical protein [Stenotrophomonas maltophilia]MDH1387870.1 hypothetical protein [Stenotrophomonas sp. GD03701]MDH1392815.1 hypothetical protein [Stenotrophomonas sp. GD03702]